LVDRRKGCQGLGEEELSKPMRKATGIFFLLMCLSGCVITAASGTRTEYEDKMKKIEKDYREMKITKDEYIRLKNLANEQVRAEQESGSMSPGQSYP
jgi:hypothetical protein